MYYKPQVPKSYNEPNPSEAREPETPRLVPPIRVQVRGEALDLEIQNSMMCPK